MQSTLRNLVPLSGLALLFLGVVAPPAGGSSGPQDSAPGDDADAEPKTGVLRHEAGVLDGYTLISPLRSTETFLIDMDGEIAHAWGSELAPSGPVYLLDNGNLLRPGRHEENGRFNGGGIGGRIQEFDWDGFLLWDFLLVDNGMTQHHDVAALPGGNVLVIVWIHHDPDEVVARGRDPKVVVDGGLWSCSVLEIRPVPPDDGEVVWQWNSWDHLIQDFDPELADYGSIPEQVGRIDINADFRDLPPMTEAERKKFDEIERQMAALGYAGGDDDDDEEEDKGSGARRERGKTSDWLHTNSVNHQAELDLIVLSSPRMNEVWVIDHSTTTAQAKGSGGGRWGKGGDLLYRWGNPRNYGAGTEADRRLFYQHDPQWLPVNEAGEQRLLLYNNGRERPDGDYSTAVELVLPFDPEHGFQREDGQAFGPEEPAWIWGGAGMMFSPFISGVQRLSNGNTLICEGANGRLIEVDGEGAVLWEFVNDQLGEPAPATKIAPPVKGGALFRATRIPVDAPSVRDREFD